ncbi:hypothetical protein MMC29_003585 [Sticta canariensis]|nr:hypothetical protein [Sticta canariensis]
MLPTDDAYGEVSTTESATALCGSTHHLSDFEDPMNHSIPCGESSLPSISAWEGIGSWTENFPDIREDLRLQSELLVPENSCEAKAVMRGINRVAAAVRMADEVEDEQHPFVPSGHGPTLHPRQPLDNISDADNPTKVSLQLKYYRTGCFSTDAYGAPLIQTRKGAVVTDGELENQRDSDRSMKRLLNNTNSHLLQVVLLLSAAGLGMILSYWFWTY